MFSLLDLFFLLGLSSGLSGVLYFFVPRGTAIYFGGALEQITPLTEDWVTIVAAGDFLYCYLCFLGLRTNSKEWRGKIAIGLGLFGVFHFSAFYYMLNHSVNYAISVAISAFVMTWYLIVVPLRQRGQ